MAKIEAKRNLNREKLIKAAIDVFAKKGFKNASVPDIAKKAGMATGTFYLYFKDKSQIFIDTLRRISYELREHLNNAFQNAWGGLRGRMPEPDDARLALLRVYNAFFDYVDGYRNHFLMVFREGISYHPVFSELMWDIFRELMDDTRSRLNAGLQLGIIRNLKKTEIEAISWAIVGALSMSAQAYITEGMERKELIEALVDFTLQGIKKEHEWL